MNLSKIITSSLFIGYIIVAIFLFVQPKIGSSLFPYKRQQMLDQFLQKSKQQQDINLADYWRFREFYSPGSFVYKQEGLPINMPIISSFAAIDKLATPQLLFSSQRINSIGGRTKIQLLSSDLYTITEDILRLPSIILKENTHQVTLIFLKPVRDVKKVNGFLQYQPDHDEKFGDMWLEVSTIQKN